MGGQGFSDNLTYGAGANTVNDPHLGQMRQECFIQIGVQASLDFVRPFSAEVQFQRTYVLPGTSFDYRMPALRRLGTGSLFHFLEVDPQPGISYQDFELPFLGEQCGDRPPNAYAAQPYAVARTQVSRIGAGLTGWF